MYDTDKGSTSEWQHSYLPSVPPDMLVMALTELRLRQVIKRIRDHDEEGAQFSTLM